MFQYPQENEEHNFWISYADLVTGFMIIFIVITMILFTNQKEEDPPPKQSTLPVIEKPKTSKPVDEKGTIGVLKEQFEAIFEQNPKLKQVIEITDEAIIRFSAGVGNELYKENKYKPEKGFQGNLSKFFPHYFKVLEDFENDSSNEYKIKEIRIEGHTNSNGSYYHNLKLSSGRAARIQGYILDTDLYKNKLSSNFKTFLKEKTIAIGYSKIRLLDKNGNYVSETGLKEDERKSKRVEFRVLIEKKDKQDEN